MAEQGTGPRQDLPPGVQGPSEWRGRSGDDLARILANRAATAGILDALAEDTRGLMDRDAALDALERIWR